MTPRTWKRTGRGAGIFLSLGLILFLVVGCGPTKMAKDQLEIARNELSHVYRSKGYRAVRTVSHLIRGHWLRSA